MKKLTEWFPAGIKPVHLGVYETDAEIKSGPCFQYWNGGSWRQCTDDISYASDRNITRFESKYQNQRWRGLARRPSKG